MFHPRNILSSATFAVSLTMIERTVCFGTLQLKRWTIVGFDHLLFLLLFGTVFVGKKFILLN